MKRSKTETTSYSWDIEEKELTEEQIEYLKEEAESRIAEMAPKGYDYGELCAILPYGENEIYGQWEVK